MKIVIWLAASLFVVCSLSGCWALWGDPSSATRPWIDVQRGNIYGNEVREEREIRDIAVDNYNACLDRGLPGWKCEQYLVPQGGGHGAYGYGRGRTLGSVARDAMVEIHLAEGAQEDFSQNGAIRDLQGDLAAETDERKAADTELSGRVDTAQSRADAAYGRATEARSRADVAVGQAGRANGRLDKAGRRLKASDSMSRARDADLHERLRKLEEDDKNNDEEKE